MTDSRSPRGKGDPSKLKKVADTETVHHESAEKKKRRGTKKMEQLNLTSMLDVCFQLLIFFILTASFTVTEGILPAALPFGQGTESLEDPPETPINVALSTSGGADVAIHVEGLNKGLTSFEALYGVLAERRGLYGEKTPVNIKPGRAVQWQHVMNAFNQARRAKFKSVNFAVSE